MKLSELQPGEGARKKRWRIGRGNGSGNGSTAGKGNNGARARSGKPEVTAGFEGGQNPLQRRVPKRGFVHESIQYQIVNLGDLDKGFEGLVTAKELAAAGLVKSAERPIKILGDGTLSKAIQVKATRFSASARKAIESAGGKAEVA